MAIKVPHEEMEADPVLSERFQREAEVGKMLDHPGVMKVFDDGEKRSRLYMVMEWVGGRSCARSFTSSVHFRWTAPSLIRCGF